MRFGTGTIISRQAHVHDQHGGPFEACHRCNAFEWVPGPKGDFGMLIHDERGMLIEMSGLCRALLTP